MADYFDESDMALMREEMRSVWSMVRAMHGDPVCDFIVISAENDDPFYGSVGQPTYTTVRSDVECTFRPITEEELASFPGAEVANPQVMVLFDFVPGTGYVAFFDEDGSYWDVVSYNYHPMLHRVRLLVARR